MDFSCRYCQFEAFGISNIHIVTCKPTHPTRWDVVMVISGRGHLRPDCDMIVSSYYFLLNCRVDLWNLKMHHGLTVVKTIVWYYGCFRKSWCNSTMENTKTIAVSTFPLNLIHTSFNSGYLYILMLMNPC